MPAGTIVTDRLSSRSTSDRTIGKYDQSSCIVWCGSLSRSRTIRVVWNAVGGRRYSRVPASARFVSWRTPFRLFYSPIGRNPVGLSARRSGLASHSPRILTLLVTRAAHWKSVDNQDVPTSDVSCRLAGTTRRLQSRLVAAVTYPLRDTSRIHLFDRRPARARPVKDERKPTKTPNIVS